MVKYVFVLLLAHVVGDFYFQTDSSCKNKKPFGGKDLWIHVAIIFITTWAAVLDCRFWWGALAIGVLHYVTDSVKTKVEKQWSDEDEGATPKHESKKKKTRRAIENKDRKRLWAFAIDQFAHLFAIVLVSWLYTATYDCPSLWMEQFFGSSVFWVLCALILCAKPMNILIRLILNFCTLKVETKTTDEAFKAGRLIGSLERCLIVLFVVLDQYEAIGFLVAAKSILRFKEINESMKSEYVLAGTLLSVSLAIFIGLAVRYRHLVIMQLQTLNLL